MIFEWSSSPLICARHQSAAWTHIPPQRRFDLPPQLQNAHHPSVLFLLCIPFAHPFNLGAKMSYHGYCSLAQSSRTEWFQPPSTSHVEELHDDGEYPIVYISPPADILSDEATNTVASTSVCHSQAHGPPHLSVPTPSVPRGSRKRSRSEVDVEVEPSSAYNGAGPSSVATPTCIAPQLTLRSHSTPSASASYLEIPEPPNGWSSSSTPIDPDATQPRTTEQENAETPARPSRRRKIVGARPHTPSRKASHQRARPPPQAVRPPLATPQLAQSVAAASPSLRCGTPAVSGSQAAALHRHVPPAPSGYAYPMSVPPHLPAPTPLGRAYPTAGYAAVQMPHSNYALEGTMGMGGPSMLSYPQAQMAQAIYGLQPGGPVYQGVRLLIPSIYSLTDNVSCSQAHRQPRSNGSAPRFHPYLMHTPQPHIGTPSPHLLPANINPPHPHPLQHPVAGPSYPRSSYLTNPQPDGPSYATVPACTAHIQSTPSPSSTHPAPVAGPQTGHESASSESTPDPATSTGTRLLPHRAQQSPIPTVTESAAASGSSSNLAPSATRRGSRKRKSSKRAKREGSAAPDVGPSTASVRSSSHGGEDEDDLSEHPVVGLQAVRDLREQMREEGREGNIVMYKDDEGNLKLEVEPEEEGTYVAFQLDTSHWAKRFTVGTPGHAGMKALQEQMHRHIVLTRPVLLETCKEGETVLEAQYLTKDEVPLENFHKRYLNVMDWFFSRNPLSSEGARRTQVAKYAVEDGKTCERPVLQQDGTHSSIVINRKLPPWPDYVDWFTATKQYAVLGTKLLVTEYTDAPAESRWDVTIFAMRCMNTRRLFDLYAQMKAEAACNKEAPAARDLDDALQTLAARKLGKNRNRDVVDRASKTLYAALRMPEGAIAAKVWRDIRGAHKPDPLRFAREVAYVTQ